MGERGGPRKTSPLFEAACHGEAARVLLEHGVDASAKDHLGVTPLHHVAHAGRVAILLLLLENGAEVSAKNDVGTTSLLWASLMGHATVVLMLLNHGAFRSLRFFELPA